RREAGAIEQHLSLDDDRRSLAPLCARAIPLGVVDALHVERGGVSRRGEQQERNDGGRESTHGGGRESTHGSIQQVGRRGVRPLLAAKAGRAAQQNERTAGAPSMSRNVMAASVDRQTTNAGVRRSVP